MRLTPLIVVSVLFLATDGRPSNEESQHINAAAQNETTQGRRFPGGQSGPTTAPFSSLSIARDPTALLSLENTFGEHPTRTTIPTSSYTRTSPNMQATQSKGHKPNGTRRGPANTNIVFPTERPTVVVAVYPAKAPECSQYDDFGFCIKIDKYPSHRINAALEDAKGKYLEYFEPPDVDVRTYTPERTDDPTEELCPSKTRPIVPDGAKNIDGEFQVFVKNEEYQQAIIAVECLQRNQPCRYAEAFSGRRATCVQKYLVRQFVVLNQKSDTSKLDKFRVPSCCSCVLKNIRKDN